MAPQPDEPEQPRFEPEIIPPDRDARGRSPDLPPYGFRETRGTQRIYIRRIGPFGFVLMMLVVALLALAMLVVLIGTALIWIPVVVILVVAAALGRLLRWF